MIPKSPSGAPSARRSPPSGNRQGWSAKPPRPNRRALRPRPQPPKPRTLRGNKRKRQSDRRRSRPSRRPSAMRVMPRGRAKARRNSPRIVGTASGPHLAAVGGSPLFEGPSLRQTVWNLVLLHHPVFFFHAVLGHRILGHRILGHRILGHGVLGHAVLRHTVLLHAVLGHRVLLHGIILAHLVLGEGRGSEQQAQRKGSCRNSERDTGANGHDGSFL